MSISVAEAFITSEHSGRARRRHVFGAYVILDCYRHAVQRSS